MTSKKRNSIESLVDSILQQHQQQWNLGQVDGDKDGTTGNGTNHQSPGQHRPQRLITKPYTLLIQHTQSFIARYDHSTSYRQQSHQPWILQSGELWLEYIANLILQQQVYPTHPPPSKIDVKTAGISSLPSHERHRKTNITGTSGINNQTRILFLTTLPLTSTSTLNVLQTKYGTNRVQSISCCRLGSFIDLNIDEERNLPSECDLERLDTIILTIKDLLSSTSTISAIFIDSITPILIRHGYMKMIQFIQQLMDVCTNSVTWKVLIVVPIRVEMFTSVQQQHIMFEHTMHWDAILNAVAPVVSHEIIIHVSHGAPHNMALFLRRGVPLERRDYIRRDSIPYQVIVVNDDESTGSNMHRNLEEKSSFSLVKNTLSYPIRRRYCIDCWEMDSAPDNAQLRNDAESDKITTVAGKLSNLSLTARDDTIRAPSITKNTAFAGTAKAVALQLDDGTRRYPPQETTASATPTTTIKKPNIYLEENDPDMYDNDYDEDEPDDDLDL
jgi:hypothetical protein